MKPYLGLAFCDFWAGFQPERWALTRLLRDAFEVRVDPAAEITVCGPFGRQHAWRTGTKVLCTGEPARYLRQAYDFWIDFDLAPRPRQLRWPYFMWELHRDRLDGLRPAGRAYEEWRQRPQFCNFVYSNARCPARNQFFDALHRLRPVTAAGPVRRNAPPVPTPRSAHDWRWSKIAYQRDFRFTIAFEHREKPGYTTEKLPDALFAGTIPIYWGNPEVAVDVRPGSFINAYDFTSLEALAEHVVAVDDDAELARRYLGVSPWYDGALDRAQDALIAFFGEIRDAARARRLWRLARPLWVAPAEQARRVGRRALGLSSQGLRGAP